MRTTTELDMFSTPIVIRAIRSQVTPDMDDQIEIRYKGGPYTIQYTYRDHASVKTTTALMTSFKMLSMYLQTLMNTLQLDEDPFVAIQVDYPLQPSIQFSVERALMIIPSVTLQCQLWEHTVVASASVPSAAPAAPAVPSVAPAAPAVPAVPSVAPAVPSVAPAVPAVSSVAPVVPSVAPAVPASCEFKRDDIVSSSRYSPNWRGTILSSPVDAGDGLTVRVGWHLNGKNYIQVTNYCKDLMHAAPVTASDVQTDPVAPATRSQVAPVAPATRTSASAASAVSADPVATCSQVASVAPATRSSVQVAPVAPATPVATRSQANPVATRSSAPVAPAVPVAPAASEHTISRMFMPGDIVAHKRFPTIHLIVRTSPFYTSNAMRGLCVSVEIPGHSVNKRYSCNNLILIKPVAPVAPKKSVSAPITPVAAAAPVSPDSWLQIGARVQSVNKPHWIGTIVPTRHKDLHRVRWDEGLATGINGVRIYYSNDEIRRALRPEPVVAPKTIPPKTPCKIPVLVVSEEDDDDEDCDDSST